MTKEERDKLVTKGVENLRSLIEKKMKGHRELENRIKKGRSKNQVSL